jgi:hypothetical protein
MSQSHVITEKERGDLKRRIARGMNKAEASHAIDWLTEEIKARKAIEAEDLEPEDAA